MADAFVSSDARFASDVAISQHLPALQRQRVLETTGSDFLEAVAEAALYPTCTEKIFTYYPHLMVEIASRWTKDNAGRIRSLADDINVLGCLAKVFPFAQHLRPLIKDFLSSDRFAGSKLQDVDERDLEVLLLAAFRLLSADPESFSESVKPTFLSTFFSHDSILIRYLAIQCLCIVMRFADAFEGKLVQNYIGSDEILGIWEGKQIDYRLLKLFEEQRWVDLERGLTTANAVANEHLSSSPQRFTADDMLPTTASIGGMLVPRGGRIQNSSPTFVQTVTAVQNLKSIGGALLRNTPILIIGPGGSGKTTLVHESARLLNRQPSMITLHLNEQTDAKSLLGLYTSSTNGESFEWQPGVLTKAVQQGRWVLIEDIDRAPSEVLGVLRPIIENGELFLPSRKERVRPGEGFRVFATIKTAAKSGKTNLTRHAWLANERLWNLVEVQGYSEDEISQLLEHRYSHISLLLPAILQAHALVCKAYTNDPLFRAVQSRLPSLRDLLKWCRRTSQRVRSQNLDLATSGMPAKLKFDIFKDAVDCYAAYHSDSNIHGIVCLRIAQALNISPEQTEHALTANDVNSIEGKSQITIGRSKLQRNVDRRQSLLKRKQQNFAMTNQAKRTLDSVAAACSNSEPLLLVGETGVGKTTQVQYLADLVNQKLTVVNLSQQSEAADLLGGLKPITTRSLIIPLVDQFSTLFDDTFSNKRNEKFQSAISKSIAKENWPRLVILWHEAVQMADNALKKPFQSAQGDEEGQSAKRRKLVSKYGPLRERWTDFSSKLNHLRAQVERGDKNHSFAFVEGRLVQAVRGGEWLLLDEVNLAAADTLDHIMGLLGNGDDEKPSLLLTEAGNIERIIAHPSFRIFAAMNPATDTGKKDLAPGVRSRFTEIYVMSGDSDLDDLIKIIETYLSPALSSDKRAASDLAKAYLALKKLNEDHRLTDGAGDIPHFSIRSLVRCLLYVMQHCASHGLRRSMYEGFAMSFFTVLSIESEKLALPVLTGHLLANVKNPRSFLSQQPKMPFDVNEYVAFKHHLVLRGANSPDKQSHYIRTPSVERNLLNLARATSMRRFPILLQGPTSAGKTSMIEYLAKFTGNRFVRINNHEHTDLQEYLGSYATGNDGKLEFREGVLVEALRKGHWIVLDELNLAPSDVLEALNRLLDDNRELLIPESQEIVRPHPKFMLFATQNPAGLYGGRKRMSRAFRNRFLELHFDDIPEDELEVILRERTQIAPTFCTLIVQVYKKLSLQRQSTRLFESRNSFATLRDLFRWAARPVDNKQQLAQHGFMLLAERVRDPSERKLVTHTIEETLRVKIDEDQLYGALAIPEAIQSSTTVVWTSAMRRLYVLVSQALKNNEPVLLVGETGCGKTQICQTVAQAFQRNLSIYNAHSNTETGDLIGSQRPIRQRSELATALLNSFSRLYTSDDNIQAVQGQDIEALIDSFDKMDTSGLEAGAVEMTRQSIAAYKSLFTWSDGSLVRSMKSGEHFLLDEISLADDSVLERLNSVLEPSRSILLAEKGPTDNFVLANPQFQFLATMNPGGDYGKRELSPALRNRLTEIWVPPLSQGDDIIPIICSKLGGRLEHFAPRMLHFAVWFKNNMQNSESSTIPLRSLLAWADFFRQVPSLDAEIAFAHGASLVYIDSLGANPAGLTNTLGKDIHAARQACINELQGLTTLDVAAFYNEIPTMHLFPTEARVGPFAVPRVIQENTSVELVFDAPTTLRNTMRIVRALQLNRPILIEGSPGVGKTAIVTALATTVGKRLTRINLSDQTDLMDLFGADAPSENEKLGNFSWRDGPLLQAMQTGGWVLLDEMNLASQSVLEGLNSCLDHRHEVYIAELDKSFICHPDFTLFAAQNPHHQGGGRKGLPASFVNRFTVVYADPFERADLMLICRQKRPEASEEDLSMVVDTIATGHELITNTPAFNAGGPWELNLRDVNRWLDLMQEYNTLSAGHHFACIIGQRFRSPAASVLLKQLREQHLGIQPELTLYRNLTAATFQLGTSFMKRDEQVQHTRKIHELPAGLFPYAKTAITAINHRWPVLLVGPSGSGKTTLIRNLAALSGIKLIEFSMNADIDTMDLIGGFEQYDLRRDVLTIQSETRELLIDLMQESLLRPSNSKLTSFLVTAYEHCVSINGSHHRLAELIDQLAQHMEVFNILRERLDQIISRSTNSRFVWNDGFLIDSLQDGSWLVLDNANLCNPSVLDRLNSLLEPKGVLTISEQHSGSAGDRVIQPHPDFRIFLTMDPKYGELSRAMRNRSMEVFLHPSEQVESVLPKIGYPTSNSLYRLRLTVHKLRAIQDNQSEFSSIDPYVGTLTEADEQLLFGQIHNIAHPDASSLVQYIRSYPETYALLSTCWQTIWPAILSRVRRGIASPDQLKYLHAEHQPRTFVHNDALIKLLENTFHLPNIRISARQYFVELRRAQLQWKLNNLVEVDAQLSKEHMTILQQSLYKSANPKRNQRDKLPNANGFLTSIVSDATKINSLLTTDTAVSHLQSVLNLAEDMFNFFNHRHIQLDTFHAYLQVAQDLIRSLPSFEGRLKNELEKALSLFDDQFVLQSGQSLHRMWTQWKPITSSTHEQLRAVVAMEGLLTKFDFIAKGLPRRREEFATIRLALSTAYKSITTDKNPLGTVATFSEAIETLAEQSSPAKRPDGHFTSTFEGLLRALVTRGKVISELDFQRLSLFTCSPPVVLDHDWLSIPSILRRLAYLDSGDMHSVQASAFDVFVDLKTAVAEPLSLLDYVDEEMKELASTMSSYTPELLANDVDPVLNCVHQLLLSLLTCHNDLFTEKARLYLFPNSHIDLVKLAHLGKHALKDFSNIQVGCFEGVYTTHLLPVITTLASEHVLSKFITGNCLTTVCVAALKLLVPDKAFDPAAYPILINQRHQRRAAQLQANIASYKGFQEDFTGSDRSTLISIIEDELDELGESPPAPLIVRPEKSELPVIQQEFTTILKSVIGANQLGTILSCPSDPSSNADEATEACKVVQSLVSRIVDRLNRLNRAYDDFVKPIMWLLQSLSFGIKLILQGFVQYSSPSNASILKSIPLLGATPNNTIANLSDNILSKKRVDISWLDRIRFKSQMERSSKRSQLATTTDFLSLVDKFYIEWKTRLTKDQVEAEAKSRYYAYRGEDDQEEEINESELVSLFPTYDDDAQVDDEAERQHDPRFISVKLADIHRMLHQEVDTPEWFHNHLLQALSDCSSTKNTSEDTSLRDLLPGIFLQMQESMTEIQRKESTPGLNIYTDSDVVESRNLVKLVTRLQDRFRVISQQWPEHAVPLEVLSYSDELLAFKIDEPIAKLLTKTEKLLEIVSQWQSVASREWSVAELMEDLTNLIIHWRRLELSSWSRLLNIEKRSAEEAANAWYFIAYEALIYNSRLIVDQAENDSTYCQELARTLEDFLRSTTLGQYHNRLTLLQTLNDSLSVIASEDDRLSPIVRCVSGVLYHYERYQSDIQQKLSDGRVKLEMDLKEQIKLASWKDTNVRSLRDSARRSHFKLFKIVRKYRALLSQPLSSFKASEIDMTISVARPGVVSSPQHKLEALNESLQMCAKGISDWALRPERLKNPSNAAMSIKLLFNTRTMRVDVPMEISTFRSEISSAASELRKQTPGTLTEENTSFVRHLRERKRRLLTETIRAVTQMGVRRNLGTADLIKQSSTSVILASSADINLAIDKDIALAANAGFHEVLDLLPGVRKAVVEHSDDLTDGETRRAVGLLEGLLSIQIAQRADLALAFEELEGFEHVLKPLKNMQNLQHSTIGLLAGVAVKQNWVLKALEWLPHIVEVACKVLNFQSAHGNFRVPDLIQILENKTTQLVSAKSKLENFAELPNGLIDQNHADDVEVTEAHLRQFGDVLATWQEKEPKIAYLLQQIIPWTRPFSVSYENTNGAVHTELNAFDTAVRRTLDSMFVAMQNVATGKSPFPESSEDQGWLVKTDKALEVMAKSLHLGVFAKQLKGASVQLQYLPREQFLLGISLMNVALPIIEQYYMIAKHLYILSLNAHYETSRLGVFLTKSFVSLATEGFCTPHEPSQGQEQSSGKLENGTGLGDGEGAEDISKDVGDDEDLSELAQAEKQEGEQEMDKETDAVDMGADELEGDMGSGDEQGSEDEKGDQSGSEDENDMDEETGSVDDLDPSAVDEKLWDDMRTETEKEEKEMKGENKKGQETEEQTAKEDGAKGEENDEMEGMEQEEEDEDGDDDEGQGRPEAENIDPHLQEEEALELPEEMQLTGEEEGRDDEISENGMDELSDIDNADQPVPEQVDDIDDKDMEEREGEVDETESNGEQEDEEAEGKAQDEEVIEDQVADGEDDNQDAMDTRENEMQYDLDENEGGDTGTANQRDQTADEAREGKQEGLNEKEDVVNEQQTQPGKASDKQESGDASRGTLEQGAGKEDEQRQKQDDALKNLAEVLEQYHQRREIMTASEDRKQGEADQDVAMSDADFEHLGEDEANADTQALGAASADQVQKIDESKAIEHHDADTTEDLPMPEDQEMQDQEEQETMAQRLSRLQSQSRQPKDTDSGTIVPDAKQERPNPQSRTQDELEEDDIEEDEVRDSQDGQNHFSPPSTSETDAATLWAHCSTQTHSLSLLLTEQLRLILAPTTATKLRGDFRTGKRLNIKRIIPYIASGYKRDKIWMRRSVPSKRNYQIMIAVDDSKSMSESGADLLAFETLAMLCKSLSMLEVGELCVVGFGDDPHIRIAHPFGQPFTGTDSGANVFQTFSFQQRGTDVRALLRQSIALFEDARLRASNDDLWQLQLIISDGHCSDHDSIRRLVRRAHELKIMIVFVVVDAGHDSIVDLKEAVFERIDPADDRSEMTVRTKRYLEGFPFGYYVVVREVGDLPGVLARVLRGWFEGVVNAG